MLRLSPMPIQPSPIHKTPHRVIYKLRELLGVEEMGGTMRLGAWPCKLEPGSLAHKAYGKTESASVTVIATNSIVNTKKL